MSEISVRLISCLAGSLMLALVVGRVYSLAVRFRGTWSGQGRGIAELSAVILATSYAYALLLSDARVDLLASLCMLAAVLSILRRFDGLMERPERVVSLLRNRDWNQFYTFAALGVLAKGPIGLALPAILVFCSLTYLAGPLAALRACFKPRMAWLIFGLIAFPWYIYAAVKWQQAFVGRQLIFENLKRFAGGEDINNEPVWYYVPSFLRSVFPWSLIFIAAVVSALFKPKRPPVCAPGREVRRKVVNLYLVCFLAGFFFFSAASGKRHSYLVPILPYMAIYLSLTLFDWWQRRAARTQERLRKAGRVGVTVLLSLTALLGAGAAAVSFVKPELAPEGSKLQIVLVHLTPEIWRLALLLLAALVLPVMLRPGAERRVGYLAVLLALFQSVLVLGITLKYRLKDFNLLAPRIREVAGEFPLAVIRSRADELFDPLMYYLDRELTIVPPEAERFPCLAQSEGRHFVLARKDFMDSLPASAQSSYRAVIDFVSAGEKLTGKKASREIVLGECVG